MIAVSFYNDNINPLIAEYQRKVFDHFGLPLIQHKYNVDHSHAFAIDWWLRERWKHHGYDNIAMFDIDCIPLNEGVLKDADVIVNDGWLYGAAQKANHIPNSDVYCSPAFCCFSHKAYMRAKSPSFSETSHHDVGGHLTNEFIRSGHRARLLWPSHVENPLWDLQLGRIKFGHGTTYNNTVYHAFESRFNHESTSRFITKCKEVIGE